MIATRTGRPPTRYDPATNSWWCPHCRRRKPRACFGGLDPDVPRSYCRRCEAIRTKLYRETNPRPPEARRRESWRNWASRHPDRMAKHTREHRATPIGKLCHIRSRHKYEIKRAKTEAAKERNRKAVEWLTGRIEALRRERRELAKPRRV